MLVNFEEFHQRYFQGRKCNDIWIFESVNPERPKAGVQLSTHQVFSSSGALAVALYVRNEINAAGAAIRVHAGLKLQFTRKVDGTYLLHRDPERISVVLDIGDVQKLYSWLSGNQSRLYVEAIRPGRARKNLRGFESDQAFALALKADEFDGAGGIRSILIGLSEADVFHLQMHCVGLAKLLYPSLSDTVVLAHLQPRKARTEYHCSAERSGAKVDGDRPSQAGPIDAIRHGASASPSLEKRRKAVYAVGMNKWPRRDIATIEEIQAGPEEAMDRLVKAGNAGDFVEWDRIFSLVHR
ncbi:hypothetical protein [Pseudomonas guariconensis]|uniref:hypothetical protein n=1 Tax=Pseudomonas guariconensis TaxID=1288410 RepID=UPI003905AAC0